VGIGISVVIENGFFKGNNMDVDVIKKLDMGSGKEVEAEIWN
jgi:hypothetical protein